MTKRKYLCPECDCLLYLVTTLTGWEKELVDPDTGETDQLVEVKRSDIHMIEYQCSECDWEGAEDFFEAWEEDDG